MQYAQDNDERLPVKQNNQYMRAYGSRIYPYIKSTQVFLCPSAPKSTGPNAFTISYAANSNFSGGNSHMTSFVAPTKTIILVEFVGSPWARVTSLSDDDSPRTNGLTKAGDSMWDTVDPGNGAGYPRARLTTGTLGGQSFDARNETAQAIHLSGANYAFIDGHVKWLRGDVVSPGGSPARSECNQKNVPPVNGCGTNPGDRAAGTSGTINGVPIAATFSVR